MFELIKYYRYGLFLICLVLIAYGLLRIFSKRADVSIKAAAGKYRLFKRKKLLNLLIFVVFIANCFLVPLQMQQSATAEISLNYMKASQGLNPNGTRYNQADILSAEVLGRAIEKGALKDVTESDLRSALSVAPKVQGNSGDEGSYFISTQFVLSYNANKKTEHLHGEQLLTLVSESYKEWFLNKYSDNTSALKMDFSEKNPEDYLDVCEYFKNKGNLIGAYMTSMAEQEPAFQSEANGETFQSLASQAYKVSNTMVEKLEAYVMENGVSKDAPSFMSRLSFENIFDHFDALKADYSSKNNLTAISMYEDDLARIVLIPTYDTNFQFYMSQTRIGIDDFAESADSFAQEKTIIRSGIAKNNRILRQLSSGVIRSGIDQKAETLILQIEEELTKLAGEAQELVKEYSAKQANEYMLVTVHTLESRAGKAAVNALLYTLLFAAAAHCVAFAVTLGRKNRRERKDRGRPTKKGGKQKEEYSGKYAATARFYEGTEATVK